MTATAPEPPLAPSPAQASALPPIRPRRLLSVDVFRGFVMMALAFQGFFPGLADAAPNNPILRFLGHQFEHVPWQGGVFWDLIQPSFMFLVGVSITFSYFSRRARGSDPMKVAGHVAYRSLVLIALGVMLHSGTGPRTVWMFSEVLCQIGLAYPFAYLLVNRNWRTQLLVCGMILLATWVAFFLYPVPAPGYDYAALGLSAGDGQVYSGLFAHWNKFTSLPFAFDRWLLNLLPRSEPFLANFTYTPTLNFVPSIVTLVFGVMTGDLLRRALPAGEKARRLVLGGAALFATGLVLGHTLCPIVKTIWTPSWVLASTGWVCWILAGIVWAADVRGWDRWCFPLTVLGRNSLAMYLLLRMGKERVRQLVATHTSSFWTFHYWTFESLAVILLLWLICYWMYRREIFLSI